MTTTPLFIEVDPAARQSLHDQVYHGLRQAMADGRLSPGDYLPSTRALADDLRVGRNTVLRALDRLKAEGLVEGHVGSGTRVTKAVQVPQPFPMRDTGLAAQPPPRAFEVGQGPLDVFPSRTWARVAAHRWRESTDQLITSGDACGYRPLREVIAEYVRLARGIECRADEVLITSGAQHAVDIIARALLRAGDAVLVEDPGRRDVRCALESASLRALPIAIDREGFNVTRATRATDARMAIVTPGAHFPSGIVLPMRRRQQLVDWARRTNAWLVEDDQYAVTRFVGRSPPTLHRVDSGEHTVFVGSFAHVMFPGMRIGYIVAPPSARDRLLNARTLSEQHAPTSTQAILADFVGGGHLARHLRRYRATIGERYHALVRGLAMRCGGVLDPWPASAGIQMIAWLPCGFSELAVVEAAARHGVVLEALSSYRYEAGRPGLVLGFGGWTPQEISDATARLGRALAQTGVTVGRTSSRGSAVGAF